MSLKPLAAAAAITLAAGCGGGPSITITSPAPGFLTTSASAVVSGVTAGGIRLVLIDGVPASSADGFRTWTALVPLSKGDNVINATGYDGNSRATTTSLTVTRVEPFSATGPAMSFWAIYKQQGPAQPETGYVVSIEGGLARWRASGPPWARLSQASGEGRGEFVLTADAEEQPLGFLQSEVTVTDDDSGEVVTFPASLSQLKARLVMLPPIHVPGADSMASFIVDGNTSAAELSQDIIVSDELGGTVPSESVPWAVQSISAPWVKLTASSYGTAPPPQVQVIVDVGALAGMAAGQYEAQIALEWRNDQQAVETETVLVLLDLRSP